MCKFLGHHVDVAVACLGLVVTYKIVVQLLLKTPRRRLFLRGIYVRVYYGCYVTLLRANITRLRDVIIKKEALK